MQIQKNKNKNNISLGSNQPFEPIGTVLFLGVQAHEGKGMWLQSSLVSVHPREHENLIVTFVVFFLFILFFFHK